MRISCLALLNSYLMLSNVEVLAEMFFKDVDVSEEPNPLNIKVSL